MSSIKRVARAGIEMRLLEWMASCGWLLLLWRSCTCQANTKCIYNPAHLSSSRTQSTASRLSPVREHCTASNRIQAEASLRDACDEIGGHTAPRKRPCLSFPQGAHLQEIINI
jgi:hypothetical protein